MPQPSKQPLEKSLQYLPAFFRAEAEAGDGLIANPINALLETFESEIHLTEQFAQESGALLDPMNPARHKLMEFPRSAVKAAPEWETNRLRWLASWFALELESQWLTPTDQEPQDCVRGRRIVKEISRVYRKRGTSQGLVEIIELFYGFKAQVIEHSWPLGMVIGESSTIGSDCWLTDEADSNHFVVLIKEDELTRERLGAGSANPIDTRVGGQGRGRWLRWISDSTDVDIDQQSPPAVSTRVRAQRQAAIATLLNLIDREKPMHLRCFTAFEARMPIPAKSPEPHEKLIIEVVSTIEDFCIG